MLTAKTTSDHPHKLLLINTTLLNNTGKTTTTMARVIGFGEAMIRYTPLETQERWASQGCVRRAPVTEAFVHELHIYAQFAHGCGALREGA